MLLLQAAGAGGSSRQKHRALRRRLIREHGMRIGVELYQAVREEIEKPR